VRVLALFVAIAVVACTSNPPVVLPTPPPTHEPGIVNVSVLLDLSGSRSPNGQPQRDAMQLWMDQVRTTSPVKLRVKFVDVAGSDAKLLLELRRAVVEDRADAVVIGAPMPQGDTLLQAIQVASVPVLFTMPVADPTASIGGRFTFALAPTPASIARALANDLITRGVLEPMLLAGIDSPASNVERAALVADLRDRSIIAPTPVNLAAPGGVERARNAALVARSVVLFGASAPYGDLVRSIPSTVIAPRVYLSYLTETADVTSLRAQSALVTWPGSRSLLPSFITTGTQRAFLQAFRDRHGAPSTLAATAYDALGLIEFAAVKAPTELDAANLRLRLETGGLLGVVTRYTFTPQRHTGFALEDLVYLRWDATQQAPALP
jgi:ABC-type branched-subunit amino acid transport system substrate-binding protein